VILPALALARHDRARDGLIAEDEDYIYQTSRAILAHLEDDLKARTDLPGVEPVADVLILGCPAHQEAEELSLQMLGLLLRHDGCRLEILSTKALPAEVEARVEREKPALVFIAVLPPGGVIQARYLCKRLRKRFADLPLVVGYWGESSDFDRLLVRFRSAGASYLTTSLLQSCSQIRSMLAQDPAPGLQPVGGP
jgi:hypothetical protein